jgi:hypothetical protein
MDDNMKELDRQPNNDKINRPAEDIGRSRTDQGMKEVLNQLGPEQDTQTQTVTATVERTPVDRVDPHAENIVDVRTKLGAEQSTRPARPDRTNEQIAQYHEVKNLVANAWKDTVVSEGDQTTMTRREVVKKGLVAGLLVKLGWKTIHINNHPQSSITTTEGSGIKSNDSSMKLLHIVNASEGVNVAEPSTEQPATVSEKNEKDLTPLEKEFDELLVPELFANATEQEIQYLRKQIIPFIENIAAKGNDTVDAIIRDRTQMIQDISGSLLNNDNGKYTDAIEGLIYVESKNDPRALNPNSGATGLLQVIPSEYEKTQEELENSEVNLNVGINSFVKNYNLFPDLAMVMQTHHDGVGNMAFIIGRYLEMTTPENERSPKMNEDIAEMTDIQSTTRPEIASQYVKNGALTFAKIRSFQNYDQIIREVAKNQNNLKNVNEYSEYGLRAIAADFAVKKRRQGQPILPAA